MCCHFGAMCRGDDVNRTTDPSYPAKAGYPARRGPSVSSLTPLEYGITRMRVTTMEVLRERSDTRQRERLGSFALSRHAKLSGQRVAGAASACFILLKNAEFDEFADIPKRRIGRALLDQRPFARSKLAFKPVQEAIENIALPIVDSGGGVLLPEVSFLENSC